MRPGRSRCSHRSICTAPLAGPQMWLWVTRYPSNDEVGTYRDLSSPSPFGGYETSSVRLMAIRRENELFSGRKPPPLQ
jgi:hypothetical protein